MKSNSLHRLAQLSVFLFGASASVTAVCLKSMRTEFGLSYGEGGLLVSARSLTLAVVVTASGFLAGRWGKKPLLTAGMLLLGGTLAAVSLIIGDSYLFLVLIPKPW